jgi:hypothetical protein
MDEKKAKESYTLLWDCFVNWSETLEKMDKLKKPSK